MVSEQITSKATLSVVFVLSWGSCASAMYDPYIGRFVSRDPIGYSDSFDLFLYATGRPQTHRDPMGTLSIRDKLPPLIDPPKLPNDKSKKCGCKDFLERTMVKHVYVRDGSGGGKFCKVTASCSPSCKGGAPGYTTPPDPSTMAPGNGGDITICIQETTSEYELGLIFYHELQHANDFCHTPPPDERCPTCEDYENHAHEVNCGMLYDKVAEKDKFDACVNCGTFISCMSKCPGKRRPEPCTWNLLGVDPRGKREIPAVAPY